jgi:glycosyltransferase involved in cell wall biosynthesis
MPTAVLDLELESLPAQVTDLHHYSKALVLIRLRGRPVGQTTLPVIGGRITGAELRNAVVNVAEWPFWERWLHEYLQWNEVGANDFVPPQATIAVCTRDRPEDLKRCLDALLRLPEDGQELLVVDNCPSSEATRHLVERYTPQVRYVREDRPGASAARNRALRESKHEIVAFSDDDAAPDVGWLRALLRNFHDPLVVCVTGLTMPLELETEAQEWFERHCPFGRGFDRRVFDATEDNPMHVSPAGTSANMALRKTIIADCIGLYDEALGPGTPTRTGEDFEMFSRILRFGYRIVYEPSAVSWHRHRRTWEELCNALYGHGTGVYGFLVRSLSDGELSAPLLAWGWFRYEQLPALARSLLGRPGSKPLDLLTAEIRGCLAGPCSYLFSRIQLRRRNSRA